MRLTDTHLWKVWNSMRSRCLIPSNGPYKNYGGRGIKICDDWNEFWRFKRWAISAGYCEGLSLDRIDNNGNYEPDNCRWVPRAQQLRNKSDNRYITAFGETKLLIEWKEDPRCVVSYMCVWKRLARGWTPERALTTKSKGN